MATEQQLNDLIYELRDLTQTLRPLTSTAGTAGTKAGGGMSDRGVDRLITAIGKLAVSLDKSSTNKDIELQKFTAEVNNATDAQEALATQAEETAKAIKKAADDQAEAMRKAGLSAEELAKEQQKAQKEKQKADAADATSKISAKFKEQRFAQSSSAKLWEAMGNTGGAAEVLKTKFFDLGGESLVAQTGLQILSGSVTGASKSIVGYTKSIYAGKRGVDITAKALTDFVTPIGDAVSGIGTLVSFLAWFTPAGKIFQGIKGLGAVVKYGKWVGPALVGLGEGAKLAAKYNEVGAEQSKVLYKSFQALSQVGATAEGDLGGVFNTLQTLGMSVAEIEDFNEMVRTSSKDLALMGATVGTGLKNFAGVAGELVQGKLGQELQEMGMSLAEQRKLAMEYMAIQSRSGQMQLKNTSQLVKDTAAFAKELDLAARLTGDSREEQAKKIRAAQMDERFRAAQREAEQSNDQQAIDRLNKAAALAAKFTAIGAEEEARGIRHIAAYYAKTGQIAPGGSDESLKLFYTYGAQAIREGIEKGGIEGFAGMVKSGAKMSDATLRLQSLLGRQGGGPLTAGVGQFEAQTLISNIERTMRESGFTGTIEDYVKTERGKQVTNDAMAKLMVNTDRTQQNTALVLDQGVNTFNNAADLSNRASIAFNNAVQEFGKIVKLPGGGYTTTQPKNSNAIDAANAGTTGTIKNGVLTAETKVAQLQAQREQLEKDKGRGAEETKQARIAEAQARRDAEIERAKAETARRNAARGLPPPVDHTKSGAGATSTKDAMQSYLQKMIGAESQGQKSPNRSGPGGTPTSSAFGIGQMLKGTFEGLASKAKPDNALYGKTFENYKQDVNLQKEALTQYTANSKKRLEDAGIAATDSALYMAHFLGAEGAIRLLKSNESTALSQAVSAESMAANANVFGKLSTVGDLKKWADTKMGGTGYKMSSLPSGPRTTNQPTMPTTNDVATAATKVSQVTPMSADSRGTDQQIQMLTAQVGKLDELVTLMRTQNNISQSILRTSQA